MSTPEGFYVTPAQLAKNKVLAARLRAVRATCAAGGAALSNLGIVDVAAYAFTLAAQDKKLAVLLIAYAVEISGGSQEGGDIIVAK
jgi:hypothetical protein